MCTGRVDLAFVLRAFSKGADGVFIGGCWPGECHYVTEGNFDVLKNVYIARMILGRIGVNPERLRLEWISASEGMRYAEVMNDFGKQLKAMGPLGAGEGMDEATLKLKLEAVSKIIPYIKLVERERLRPRMKSEEEYKNYFASEDVSRLFDELVMDKLAISEITLLLRDKPLTTGEISQSLGLKASVVARHLKSSTLHGLIRFDEGQKRYALA